MDPRFDEDISLEIPSSGADFCFSILDELATDIFTSDVKTPTFLVAVFLTFVVFTISVESRVSIVSVVGVSVTSAYILTPHSISPNNRKFFDLYIFDFPIYIYKTI